MTGARGMARSAASALVGMAAAASASAAADTTAILPNFSIMLLPLITCLPNETSNKARAGISRPPSRDISRYGKSENRWVTWKHFWFGSWPCQNTQPGSFALVWRSSNGFRFARITRHIQSWSRLRFQARSRLTRCDKNVCPYSSSALRHPGQSHAVSDSFAIR
jgi:hypothetical protein